MLEPQTQEVTTADSVSAWAAVVAREASGVKCTTLGMTAGSRFVSDRRIIDRIVAALERELLLRNRDARILVVRLEVFPSKHLDRREDQPEGPPQPVESRLGSWFEVSIPVPIGRVASWSLEQLPAWLPKWKSEFRLILIDLGAMHLVPSRMVGRLCDGCYVLLGPDGCAAYEWILQHIAWLDRSGSTICGTVLARHIAA